MTVTKTPSLAHRSFSLPTIAASVPTARREARQLLVAWLLADEHPLADAALLILSELVTNSVRHAAVSSPLSDITLTLSPDALIIAVHDRHPTLPAPLPEARPDGSGGRGLAIVAALADEVGGGLRVAPDEDGLGKTSTVHLPR
ncbi:ATP-binding protein [Streptomyces zagrosensis]|uniref:Anti-sigma regulatory factor (Ser/Thr protein kinase) n=1 Tax=Streptomyces zagrosensis TaxID=1042984 RepID=A0A7W9Q5R9_9ACTN|nr:ATP-binding protein [Streptomyces zagrosensis]MBB5933097.1 anti-sigma regulatory factor (Ser/Thr protein kinase) [Streptomyces zagrosensis]